MRSTISVTCLAALLAAGAAAGATAHAAPALRLQVNQHGDFLLIGNTLGYDCDVGTPLPVVGTFTAGACSSQSTADANDSSPDLYWVADDPAAGQCLADINTTAAMARSTAVLVVPPGATVTNAFLYWSATNTSGLASTSVTVDRIGTGAFGPTVLNAMQSWVPGVDNAYQSVADVTTLVQQNGSGAYRVSGIDMAPVANLVKDVLYGGWWLVAFYQLPADPLRNLALFDGLDVVKSGSNQSANLTGFLVPNAGFDGKLGVVAFEGDNQGTGDSLFFNNVQLSNALNPLNNFFNSTRSSLGLPVSVAGDLPQLTGTAQSMAGVDIDVVDITADLTMGQTSAPIQATTSGDTYYLAGFITSISTFAPDFISSTKTAKDDNGGLLLPGDVVTYTISATNTGNDASKGTVLTDVLPAQVTYVAGSIKIDGAAQTDAAGDDEAEYTAATKTLTARLGMNATAAVGGSIAAGATSTVSFQVTVNAGVMGDIANQGSISAGGQMGAPPAIYLTDGNGNAAGNPPTVITVSPVGTSSSSSSSSSSSASSTSAASSSSASSSSGGTGGMGAGGAGGQGGAGGHGGAGSGTGGGAFIAVGNGLCNASPARREGESGAWLLGAALAGLAARRRRRAG